MHAEASRTDRGPPRINRESWHADLGLSPKTSPSPIVEYNETMEPSHHPPAPVARLNSVASSSSSTRSLRIQDSVDLLEGPVARLSVKESSLDTTAEVDEAKTLKHQTSDSDLSDHRLPGFPLPPGRKLEVDIVSLGPSTDTPPIEANAPTLSSQVDQAVAEFEVERAFQPMTQITAKDEVESVPGSDNLAEVMRRMSSLFDDMPPLEEDEPVNHEPSEPATRASASAQVVEESTAEVPPSSPKLEQVMRRMSSLSDDFVDKEALGEPLRFIQGHG